jgi:hypothetical protein
LKQQLHDLPPVEAAASFCRPFKRRFEAYFAKVCNDYLFSENRRIKYKFACHLTGRTRLSKTVESLVGEDPMGNPISHSPFRRLFIFLTRLKRLKI